MIGQALACAVALFQPAHLDTIEHVIAVESGGRELAINVNRKRGQPAPTQPPPASSVGEAAAAARRFIALGYTVDLGPMQVNSANLSAYGITVEQALDPCTNVRVGSQILAENFEAAVKAGYSQASIWAALSRYNTGDFERGWANGYLSRYLPFASGVSRQIAADHGMSWRPAPQPVARRQEVPRSAAPNPYTASQFFTGESSDVPNQ